MKIRSIVISLTLFLGLMSQSTYATPLLEETGLIQGSSILQFEFIADQTPLQYEVTLTDLNFMSLFDSLSVTIATSTAQVATLYGPGVMFFDATFGTTYFASVAGDAGGDLEVGLFGLLIEKVANPVPEPATLLLFSTGLVGLVGSRFRRKL